MKDDLEQLLRSLHLRKIAELFDAEVKRAEQADLPYQEFVARLLRAQWQVNQEVDVHSRTISLPWPKA